MINVDDVEIDKLSSDIRAIVEDEELSLEDRIVALIELPDPTMDETKASAIMDEYIKKLNQNLSA